MVYFCILIPQTLTVSQTSLRLKGKQTVFKINPILKENYLLHFL